MPDETPLQRGFVFSDGPVQQPGQQHAAGQGDSGHEDAGALQSGGLFLDELLHALEQFREGGDVATVLVVHVSFRCGECHHYRQPILHRRDE